MSRIRSRNTKPEMLVRRYLYAHGFRYRVNVKTLPGSPDIALRRYRTAIFVHGCFWHGHECQKGRTPKTHTEFWVQKIACNQARDIEVRTKLRALGWRTMVVWECQLKPKVRQQTLDGIAYLLNEAFLDNYRRPNTTKTYSFPEEEAADIAAEGAIEYQRSNKKSDKQQ